MNDGNYFTDADQLGNQRGITGPQPRLAPAFKQLEEFKARRPQGLWPHINRSLLADQLRDTLVDPNLVDQFSTNVCGVVAIVRVWARDFPLQYVRFALDLYSKGSAHMVGKSPRTARIVKPSVELRHASPPQGMRHADWIVAAAVRESLNRVFDYSPGEGIFAIKAFTLPGDVVREFKALGYTKIRDDVKIGQPSGYENLMSASQLYQAGWRVIMLINSGLLDGSPTDETETRWGVPQSAGLHIPDHWVGLDSAIVPVVTSGKPLLHPFKVWSWGRSKTISAKGLPVPLDAVSSRYFGYVAGRY
jgi:hypothetical protein